MAHSVSAKKRIRQNVKRRALNRWRLRSMRVAIKNFDTALTEGGDAAGALRTAQGIIDRTAQYGVIHRNQASRRISRMSAKLKASSAG